MRNLDEILEKLGIIFSDTYVWKNFSESAGHEIITDSKVHFQVISPKLPNKMGPFGAIVML